MDRSDSTVPRVIGIACALQALLLFALAALVAPSLSDAYSRRHLEPEDLGLLIFWLGVLVGLGAFLSMAASLLLRHPQPLHNRALLWGSRVVLAVSILLCVLALVDSRDAWILIPAGLLCITSAVCTVLFAPPKIHAG